MAIPAAAAVEPIDWIEQIPFGETRNYVQRVLENMEVYKNRLAGRDLPLTILADLYAPAVTAGPGRAERAGCGSSASGQTDAELTGRY